MRTLTLLLTAAVLFLGALNASAQQLAISGIVDDTYGVVVGATVALRPASGATQQTMTDGDGRYAFNGLASGSYEISVARDGFNTATRVLSLTAAAQTVDLTLTVAGFVTSVDVVDASGQSTASRMEIPDREVPNQVSVVSQQTLREQGINDLASALENVSGVITQVQYGVYEWYTISGITQQSGNDFLFVDGMALTGNRSNTQINNIEQIQVFKGPNAVLYGGAGAGQGGMVNIIRKKPQAARDNEAMYKFGRWGTQEFQFGSAGRIPSMSRLLYRVDLGVSNTDGWRQGGSKRFNVTPALTWLISDQVRVTFNESLSRDRYDLDAGVPSALLALPGFPLDRRFNPPGDFQLSRDWQNQAILNANISRHLQFRNSFFNRRNRDQYLDAETLAYTPATNTLTRGELYFQHNRRPIQNQSDLIGDYDLAGMKHRFMVGYSFVNQFNYSNRIGNGAGLSNSNNIPIPSINIADFLSGTFVDTAPIYTSFPRTRVDYSTNKVSAVYWQDQIDLTSRLHVNLAGRFDDFRRRTHNDTFNNDQFVSAGPLSTRHQTNYSYRTGAVYALTNANWIYASLSTTFQPVNTIPADGKELEPTRSRGWEIGHKLAALRGRLIATTAFRKIANYNILIPLGGNLFEQAGKSSARVVDIDVEGNPGRGFHVVGSYGFANPEFDDFKSSATGANLRGNLLPQAPRHTSRVWITKSLQVGDRSSVMASIGGRYVAGYFTNSANTIILPERTTVDGAIGFKRAKWDATVNLVNLTNKKSYFVSQINSSQFYPGPPFNASITLRYRFE